MDLKIHEGASVKTKAGTPEPQQEPPPEGRRAGKGTAKAMYEAAVATRQRATHCGIASHAAERALQAVIEDGAPVPVVKEVAKTVDRVKEMAKISKTVASQLERHAEAAMDDCERAGT